jgi:flagellar biosynthesis anti-sigma factor FlgM
MRIDFHYGPQSTEPPDRSSAKADGRATISYSKSEASQDQAQISDTHMQVQALTAEALRPSEVRHQRIQSLREAIRTGQFQANPQETAGALISHMLFPPH